jgi:hypothetical protein
LTSCHFPVSADGSDDAVDADGASGGGGLGVGGGVSEVDADTGRTNGLSVAISNVTVVVRDGQHKASAVAYRA